MANSLSRVFLPGMDNCVKTHWQNGAEFILCHIQYFLPGKKPLFNLLIAL
jgi:hypothetical protein